MPLKVDIFCKKWPILCCQLWMIYSVRYKSVHFIACLDHNLYNCKVSSKSAPWFRFYTPSKNLGAQNRAFFPPFFLKSKIDKSPVDKRFLRRDLLWPCRQRPANAFFSGVFCVFLWPLICVFLNWNGWGEDCAPSFAQGTEWSSPQNMEQRSILIGWYGSICSKFDPTFDQWNWTLLARDSWRICLVSRAPPSWIS